MTAMREEAFELLEKMPEDKLVFIIQIMQGVNSLYNSGAVESKKDAFLRMEQIREMFRMTMLNWHLIERKNMESKILVDTNVLLDYFLTREPFFDDAKQIIEKCAEGKINACIAAHSVSNMFFILRKTYDVKERRELLLSLFEIFDVEGIDSEKLMKGLKNETFSDFEDCLQMECAESFCAQYIVTRNTADYVTSKIPAVTPTEYLESER